MRPAPSVRDPLFVRAFEVPGFSEAEWQEIDEAGMITQDLTPEEVGQAFAVMRRHAGLSANDCVCLVTAQTYRGILLTGDAMLRKVAAADGLRVHGELRVVDELEAAAVCSRSLLARALKTWQADEALFVPPRETGTRLEHLAKAEPRRGRRP